MIEAWLPHANSRHAEWRDWNVYIALMFELVTAYAVAYGCYCRNCDHCTYCWSTLLGHQCRGNTSTKIMTWLHLTPVAHDCCTTITWTEHYTLHHCKWTNSKKMYNAVNINKSWNTNNKSGQRKCTLACILLRVNVTLETTWNSWKYKLKLPAKLKKTHKKITNNIKNTRK
jgi:hypothetical protein